MMKLSISLITVIFIGLLFNSCQKAGCKDTNSLNYDKDADKSEDLCVFAYISSIQINQLPEFPSSDQFEEGWDKKELDITAFPNHQFPDIQIRITSFNSSSSFSNVTNFVSEIFTDNKNYPLSVSLAPNQNEFIELKSYYTLKVVDIDKDGEDEMASSFFNYDKVENNQLNIKIGDETDIVINFEER